jgi:hypothetical protein
MKCYDEARVSASILYAPLVAAMISTAALAVSIRVDVKREGALIVTQSS